MNYPDYIDKERGIQLFNDHFQNFKTRQIPKSQLIIADPPYNLGENAYASSPSWYVDGDNSNGESNLAGKEFFDTDKDFRPAEFMHFCSQMLRPEPKATEGKDLGRNGKKTGGLPVCSCSAASSSRCTTSNWVSGTDSTITSIWYSERTIRRRCSRRT